MKMGIWRRVKNGARARSGQGSSLHLNRQALFPLLIVGCSFAALASCGRPDNGASPLVAVGRPNENADGKALAVPKAEDAALLQDVLGETSALVRAHRSAYFWGRECLVTKPGQVLQRGFGVFKASALLDGFAGERALVKGSVSVFRRLLNQEGRDLVFGPSGQVDLRPTQLNGLEIQGEAATGRGLTVEDLGSGDDLRRKEIVLHTVWAQRFAQATVNGNIVTRAQLQFKQDRFSTRGEQRALVGTVAVEEGKDILIREEGRVAVTDEPLEEAHFEMVSVEETVIESGTLRITGPRGRSFSVAFHDVLVGRDDGCPVPESGEMVVTLSGGRTITFGFEPDSVSIDRSGVLNKTRRARPEQARQYPRSRFAMDSACDAGWDRSEHPKVKNIDPCADCDGVEDAPIEIQGEPPPEDPTQDVRVKISEADFYPEGLAIDARGNAWVAEGMLYTLFGLTGKSSVLPPFYLRHVLLPEAL